MATRLETEEASGIPKARHKPLQKTSRGRHN